LVGRPLFLAFHVPSWSSSSPPPLSTLQIRRCPALLAVHSADACRLFPMDVLWRGFS
jgi:hypothetical protein